MIYERFPELHSLSLDEKAALAEELLKELAAKKAAPAIIPPVRRPATAGIMEPEWKRAAREAAKGK
jgi:hypothetical protein